MNNYNVWVLTDKFTGNAKQALSLANTLFKDYLEIKLTYNFFVIIPNMIKGPSLTGLDKISKKKIAGTLPDIIISSGRRTASVAAFIKKKNPDIKIIQILWHELNNNLFDIVILPYHDKYKADNIINIEGSLTPVSPEMLKLEKHKSQRLYTELPENKIALLIGGDTKKGNFTDKHIYELIAKVNTIALKTNSGLLVSTSRRTNPELLQILRKNIKVPFFIYDINQKITNPYYSILAHASIVIVTGDSISMIVDACSSGKKVMIYHHQDFLSNKHYKFINTMFEKKYASDVLTEHDFNPANFLLLNNTQQLTAEIKTRLML